MPSRREFLSALVGSAVVSGVACKGGSRATKPGDTPHPGGSSAAPKAAPGGGQPAASGSSAGGGKGPKVERPALRENAVPPLHVPRTDALANIRTLTEPRPDLVEVSGNGPSEMLRAGLAAFGGIKLLVKPGDRVVLSPNFALARKQGSGVATDAELVREMIKLCFDAGAREVTCLDHTYSPTPKAFRVNGAYQAVGGTGARLLSPWSPDQYVTIDDFKKATLHRTRLDWQAVPEALLRCDVLINMPVVKHHRDAGMSGAIKKLMGCIWRRQAYHDIDLQGCIAELPTVIRPTVTIMDAVRVLTTNGPDGPGKVKDNNKLLIATDPVLADTYAAPWLGIAHKTIPYLAKAAALGAGSNNPAKAKVKKLTA